MSDPRTTADWEALLDGAADGPWEAVPHDEPGISIRTIVHDPGRYVGDIYGEDNARRHPADPPRRPPVPQVRQPNGGNGMRSTEQWFLNRIKESHLT